MWRLRLLILISLCTVWVSFDCIAQQPGEVAPAPELSLIILPPADVVHVGDLIPVDFVIQNKGTTEYAYHDRSYDRSGRMEEFALTAVDDQGNAVPDPRRHDGLRMGGGLAGKAVLAPGQSFTKTIPLNRWALINKPGRYAVTGTYHRGALGPVVAEPITVTVEPRTEEEMAGHIADLTKQLAAIPVDESPGTVMERLAYTCDARIVLTLLDAAYKWRGNAAFWFDEALRFYLPQSKDVTDALVSAASERGLAPGMSNMLKDRGVLESEIKSLIEVSLSPEHSDCWAEGALGAQRFCDDRFTARLITIAMDPNSKARAQAIYALALNRTDESVDALKKLLTETEQADGRSVSRIAADAVQSAYNYRGNSQGRPLKDEDFGPEFKEKRQM